MAGFLIFLIMEKFYLTSQEDDITICIGVVKPECEPKAVLQFIHGMCGCKERFEPVMRFLASKGVICIASDLRGHGESISDINDLGYFHSAGYRGLVRDLRQVSNWGKERFAGLPYFILGHSMGSLAARILIKEDPSDFCGIILCGSPSWNPMSRFGKWFMRLGVLAGLGRRRPKVIQKLTSDKYNKRFVCEGHQAWTCSDPEVRKSFMQNPLCNFTFTINGTYNLLAMMCKAYSSRGWKVVNPQMPILFLSGSDDPCIISERKFHLAVQAMHKVGYQHVTSILYPGMRHEVLNEVGKEEVWNEVLGFITSESCKKECAM